MRRSRKGMELAINTIVVIIIGVVLLGLGIVLVTKIVGKGQTITDDVDERLMEQLRRTQFTGGTLVAVLNPYETVERGKTAYFLLGYMNKAGSEEKFHITTKYSESSPVHNELKSTAYWGQRENFLLHSKEQVTLQNNKDHFEWLAFVASDKKMPPGEYYYDVFVCYSGSVGENIPSCNYPTLLLYNNVKQRIYVTVK